MWKGLIYKEWLKTRWFILIYTGLGILCIIYIFLRVKHDIAFSSPFGYWYSNLFAGGQYFSLLKFVPIIGALIVALAQYFPETVNKRIKLTFHLPIDENKALLTMWFFGAGTLLISYSIMVLLFGGLSLVYFPADIIVPAMLSVVPWFLAGFAAYNLTALIVLEPVWKYRILYFAVTVLFVPLLLQQAVTNGFSPVNPYMAAMVLLSSFSLLFSGYRFRKGVM